MSKNESFPTRHERSKESVSSQEVQRDQEAIRNQLERRAEIDNKQRLEKIIESTNEAIEKNQRVIKHEKEQSVAKGRDIEKPKRPASKREKQASYKKTMQEVRSNLSAPSRAFSRFIHNPVVEKTSDVAGKTIARPNAILYGSIFAFSLSLVIYLIARFYGYPLSGTESIASFILGWVVGVIYDYFRVLIGKSQ